MSNKLKTIVPPSPGKCSGCSKLLPRNEFMRCSTCKATYDLECANVDSKRFYSFYAAGSERSWMCPECVSKKPKKGNTNTPIRTHVPPSGLDVNICSNRPTEEDANITQRKKKTSLIPVGGEGSLHDEDENPATNFMVLLNEMRAVRQEVNMMRTTLSDLHATIIEQNVRIVNLETRVDTLETKLSGAMGPDVKALEETILQLKLDLEDRDQQMLANDVEIASFPETSNENPTHVFLLVARKLGLDLEDRDIVNVERIGPVRGAVEGGPAARPRPLVARLARRTTRDALLKAARVRRRVTTEGMGMQRIEGQFYVNERLTKMNRQLFQKAREAAKRLKWKYVWTRDGKIFARREHRETAYRLRGDVDIARVFDDNNVGASNASTE